MQMRQNIKAIIPLNNYRWILNDFMGYSKIVGSLRSILIIYYSADAHPLFLKINNWTWWSSSHAKTFRFSISPMRIVPSYTLAWFYANLSSKKWILWLWALDNAIFEYLFKIIHHFAANKHFLSRGVLKIPLHRIIIW